MRKSALIILFVLFFFLIEFFLFNTAGRWLMPNLLLLLVIYFNLKFGIRYSILAAVLAGILKDSFSVDIFGLNIFTFVLCAYMTTIFKRYFHYVGSYWSRFFLVFLILLSNFLANFCLQMMFGHVDVVQVIQYVFIPEMATTLAVTSFVFVQLQKCVSKFFV